MIATIIGYALSIGYLLFRLIFQKRVTARKRIINVAVSSVWMCILSTLLYLVSVLLMQFLFGPGWLGSFIMILASTALRVFIFGAILGWLVTRFMKP